MLLLVAAIFWQLDAKNTVSARVITYNKEPAVIDQAKADLQAFKGSSLHRKQLLCVTFTQPGVAFPLLEDNIAAMGGACDWAVVIYNGTAPTIREFCAELNGTLGNLIHCSRSDATLMQRTAWDERQGVDVVLSTPKTVLYHDLLPYLRGYQRVFLLDDDISLDGFNYTLLQQIWDCAFAEVPLIVQPLVAAQSPQYITYVNHQQWQTGARRAVLAAGTGLVEQQVPLFDAVFFEWFVRRVLVLTKPYALMYGADWGHDRSWCNAAKMYAQHVLQLPAHPAVCALMTGAPPVFHLNLRSMQNKRNHRELFRSNAAQVVKQYSVLFPTWATGEVIRPNNPLDRRMRPRFPLMFNLSYCPRML